MPAQCGGFRAQQYFPAAPAASADARRPARWRTVYGVPGSQHQRGDLNPEAPVSTTPAGPERSLPDILRRSGLVTPSGRPPSGAGIVRRNWCPSSSGPLREELLLAQAAAAADQAGKPFCLELDFTASHWAPPREARLHSASPTTLRERTAQSFGRSSQAGIGLAGLA